VRYIPPHMMLISREKYVEFGGFCPEFFHRVR